MNEKQADYPPTRYYDPSQPINITGALPWGTHITYPAGASTTQVQPNLQPAPLASFVATPTHKEHEHIRQIVREEMQPLIEGMHELLFRVTATFTTSYNQCLPDQALDHLMEAVQGEPDPDDEIAAILAEYTEKQFNELVQRVKGIKRE